jgi:hypothetical protein
MTDYLLHSSKSTTASLMKQFDIGLCPAYPAAAMAPMTRNHELIPRSEGMPLSRGNFREASWQYVGVCVLTKSQLFYLY